MKKPIQLTKAIDAVRNSLNRASWRCSFLLLPLAVGFACLALVPDSRAVSPPPDGGYPNQNTAEGEDALFNLDTSDPLVQGNTAVGYHALFSSSKDVQVNTAIGSRALESNTSGSANVAVGEGALRSNINGWYNTAVGQFSLYQNTASGNTAVGTETLESNTTGSANTAVGNIALSLGTGSNNTATGYAALAGDLFTQGSPGSYNTANGAGALQNYINGSFNTATGFQTLFSNSDGGSNTANGYLALFANTTGNFNVANGANALQANTTGGGNVANGGFALFSNTTGVNNVAEGFDALINNTGNTNIAIGLSAGGKLTTGSNNIDIGNAGVAGESKKIRIGTQGTQNNTYIAGIYGVTVSRGIGVIVDSTGHLGTSTSSARFKEAIKPMDKTSEAILSLEPVTFRYKHELDPDGVPQFGLVAEQVAKVDPDLVARDEGGKPYTVRYEAVNAMLLNEFLKEHRRFEEQAAKVKEQEAAIAQQREAITALRSQLEEQALQIRKVSARLTAADQSALRVVNSDRSNSTR